MIDKIRKSHTSEVIPTQDEVNPKIEVGNMVTIRNGLFNFVVKESAKDGSEIERIVGVYAYKYFININLPDSEEAQKIFVTMNENRNGVAVTCNGINVPLSMLLKVDEIIDGKYIRVNIDGKDLILPIGFVELVG